MFTPAYRQGGGAIEAHPHYIATATAIKKGTFVKFTIGTGIEQSTGTDFDDPCIGVAAEDHDANSGTSILVYDDPNIIFQCIPATESTATGGDATSWVDSSLTAADDVFIGGKIVITDTNDVAGFKVGDVLEITDFANTGGDCTVTGAGGTIAAGMKGYIFPGWGSETCHTFDTNATFDNLDMDTAGGETLNIVGTQWDPAAKKMTVFVKVRLHQLAQYYAAV